MEASASVAADFATCGKSPVRNSRIFCRFSARNFVGFASKHHWDDAAAATDWRTWAAGKKSRIGACLKSANVGGFFARSSKTGVNFSKKLRKTRLLMRVLGFLRSRRRQKSERRKELYVALVSLGLRLFLLSQADRISMLRSLWKDHKELLDPENSIMGSPGSSGGDGRNGNRGGGGGSGGSNDGSLPWKILSSLGFVVLCSTLFGAALTSKLTPSLASMPITIAWLVDFTASMVLMLSGLLINFWLLRAAALTGLAILKSCWWLFSELRDCVVAQGGWMRENVGGGGAAAVLLLSIPTFFAFLPGNRAFVTGFLVRARAFMLSVWHKLGSFRSSRRSEGMYSRVYGIFSK